MLVLLIEDDELVRNSVAAGLAEQGFEVQAEASGQTALRSFEEAPDRFAAVVVDVGIPGEIPGDQAAHRIQDLRPSIPVVVMSGDTTALIEAQRNQDARTRIRIENDGGSPQGFNVEYLIKPFTAEGLARTIRRQLDRVSVL